MFGDTAELILCSNNSVTYDIYRDEYTICDVINKIYGTYPAESIIHLKNKSLDGGYTGVSTITYASTVLSVSASADNQSLRTFQNGSKIKGIISGVKGGGKGLSSVGDKQTSDVAAVSYTHLEKMRKARRRFRFTATEQALFYELVAICNGEDWRDVFDCSNIELCFALNVRCV